MRWSISSCFVRATLLRSALNGSDFDISKRSLGRLIAFVGYDYQVLLVEGQELAAAVHPHLPPGNKRFVTLALACGCGA